MPQNSQPYAIGRVRALSRTLLDRAAIERLLAAADVEEVARVLGECGWGEARTYAEVEALAGRQVESACRLVREITPDEDVTDCFLLRYDILNLKTLFKARMLGLGDVALTPNGVLDPEKLRRAVGEARYQDLPAELREALEEIEARAAVAPDPLFVDARLDRLLFALIQTRLNRARRPDGAIRAYFTARADIANLMIALRVHRMGRDAALAGEMFVSGGRMARDELTGTGCEPAAVAALAARRLEPEMEKILADGLSELERDGALALLEKRFDDYLLSLIRPGRYDVLGIVPLAGYLLAREREAQSVRLIALNKAVGAAPGRVTDHLRRTYA